MSTDQLPHPVQPAQAEDPVWQATLEEIEREIADTDPGQMAQSEDERELHRILRFRARVVAERVRVAEQTEAMLRELDNRIKGIDYRYSDLLASLTRKLLTGKARSVKTPYGTVGFRATQPTVIVDNSCKLPAEFWRQPETPPLSIDKAKINEHFKSTGEVPAGCHVEPGGEKFHLPK
jgi:hypothetical protein